MTVTDEDRRSEQRREQMRRTMEWARTYFQRCLQDTAGGRAAMEYARRRGLTPETITRHGLGYAPDSWDGLLTAAGRSGVPGPALEQTGLVVVSDKGKRYDRFRHRLMFPIHDALGRCVAFGGRALGDDPAKYLNSPETALFSKSRVLYGFDLARDALGQRQEAIVVEGYMDAVLLHQFGFTHTLAALGTAMTDAHVKLLRQRVERLVLCFDGDEAGMRAADRAVEVSLLGGVEVRVVALEPGLDPADCVLRDGAAGFEAALQAAKDALEFKWSLTQDKFAGGGSRARRAAIESLLEFVAGVVAAGGMNPLEQGLLVRRLSGLLGLPAEAVYPLLASPRRRPRGPAAVETDGPLESDYEQSIDGMPPGLVAAAEGLLGLLITDSRFAARVDDRFVEVVETNGVWRRLYALVRDLIEELGHYERPDVIRRCEDGVVCDLVGRACAQVAGVALTSEAWDEMAERLAGELGVQRMEELERGLRQSPAADVDGGEAFGRLLETARGQDFALPARSRAGGACGP
jgi:DNA primase